MFTVIASSPAGPVSVNASRPLLCCHTAFGTSLMSRPAPAKVIALCPGA
eukprot:CAMPEP_0181488010 /NCGR_PEP_ID=MMETSP1110-20121109/48145_1 /TAXON_ID=174948 /ORGANISM="Symbiodinium sp., Strain CCMP421" /LENGTH=48 /DNA_ID= /DNA_START= /DNA_END= /DNA_ORIENTATION=